MIKNDSNEKFVKTSIILNGGKFILLDELSQQPAIRFITTLMLHNLVHSIYQGIFIVTESIGCT